VTKVVDDCGAVEAVVEMAVDPVEEADVNVAGEEEEDVDAPQPASNKTRIRTHTVGKDRLAARRPYALWSDRFILPAAS
jgi:hypothetical protein